MEYCYGGGIAFAIPCWIWLWIIIIFQYEAFHWRKEIFFLFNTMRKEPAAKTTIMSAIAIFPSESFLASKPAQHQRVQPPALQNLYNKLKSQRNATNEVKKSINY
jgi:hypothetical protein